MNRRTGRGIARARQVATGLLVVLSLALALGPRVSGASQTEGEGSTYADPDFGWSISWDPELWVLGGTASTPMNDEGVTGEEVIIAGVDQMALGVVFIGSQLDFAGDITACLEAVTTEISLITGVAETREADLALPEAPEDAEQAIAFATFTGQGNLLEGVLYTECRPLAGDDAVMSIRWLLPGSDTYENVLPDFEDLIAGISLDGAASAGEGSGEATEGDDEEADQDGEPETYTDPTYGWSITWDPAIWEGQEPEVIEGEDEQEGNLLDLYGADVSLGGVTVASLPSPTFANDLAACVAALRPQTSEELGDEDGGYVDNLREPDLALPKAPADAEGQLFEWDAGLDESQIGYFECRPLVEGEVVLFVTWTLPVGGDYEEHLPAFEELMSGLDLSESHSE